MDELDFGGMARKAKADAEAKAARQLLKEEEDRAIEAARKQRAREYLDSHVRPILERARSAFEAEGVGVQIGAGTEYPRGTQTSVEVLSFRCFDPQDPHGLRSFEAEKSEAKFLHDGNRMEVTGPGMGSYRRDDLNGIAQAVKSALDRYLNKTGG